MRIYLILFFLISVFLLSCSNDPKPNGVLDKDQMVNLLVDIHIIDGTLFEVSQFPDSLYRYGSAKYQYAFQTHHTDSAAFKKSYKYYSNKPDELFDIYEKVLPLIKAKVDSSAKIRVKADSLERVKQNKINEKIAKRAADSIARINKRKADSLKKLPKPISGGANKQKIL